MTDPAAPSPLPPAPGDPTPADPPPSAARDGALAELLQVLAERMGIDIAPEQLSQSVAESGGSVEEAAAAVGIRVRWLVAPLADAAALVRSDLPVFGRSASGSWWVLDGRVFGWVRAVPIADPRGGRWQTVGALARRIGEVNAWGLAEPVLPSAPLACPEDGSRSPARRLRALLWLERRDVAVVAVYGVVAGLLSLATPLAIQVLINWLAFGALLQPVVILGGALLACLTLAASLQGLQRIGVETIERRIFVRTVADLAARLSRVRASELDGVSGPELANRFFDVLTLQKSARTLLLDGITALLQVGVAVALLGLYHPWLLVFDLFLLAGMALTLLPLGRGAQRTAIRESKAKYAVAAWIEEIARHPAALRCDGGELAEGRADALARVWLSTRRDHFRVVLRQFLGVQALHVIASAVLLVASGALVLRGQLTVGQLVAAEFIVTAALLGFAKFADKLDTIYDLLAGIDKLGSLLDLAPERQTGLGRTGAGPARVEIEGASLSRPIGGLPPVTLTLPPGSRTVVLGAPGTGKSSLGALVAGFREPDVGAVRRDGVDLRRLRPEARYRGVVRIEAADLIAGSVRDNVALGRPGLDDERIWAALGAVGIRERIETLPDGLDTALDPTGAPLSEAERRALLVARAVASAPRLIVADGVLDGLPPEPRRLLQEALFSSGATLLLSTSDPAVVHPDARVLTLGPGGFDDRPTVAAC